MSRSTAPGAIVAAILAVAAAVGAAQQPAPQAPQGRGQGRGGPRGAQPLALDDRAGFESIFDGTLKNWDGDTRYWRAENGSIVGETTDANKLTENTFLIWRGGEPADFELKVEFRMNSTNSGIQFRSAQLPEGTRFGGGNAAGKWVLKGYQADIDHDNRYTGMIYEERGRGFLMQRGQAVNIAADGSKRIVGNLERAPDELKALVKVGDWNYVHLIARGTTLINSINGHITAIITDDDEAGRALKGLLGFQIHVGPPMKIEFRNIYMKKL